MFASIRIGRGVPVHWNIANGILRVLFSVALGVVVAPLSLKLSAAEGEVLLHRAGFDGLLEVRGEPETEWRFETSTDLIWWTNAPGLGSVFSSVPKPVALTNREVQFVRAIETDGLFDVHLLRTIQLTFTNSDWALRLSTGRTTGSNIPATLSLDNGTVVSNVGARYKGNTSFMLGGNKKSVNLDINWTDTEARLMGYRAVNLNNAAGDETIMREPLYFNVMREYAPSPSGAMTKVEINGANWGVYSMVDQLNNDLVDEWFPSHEGDRWRAPNIAGGGGGFAGGSSAFTYLGTNVTRYTNNYELKSDNSTNAWPRLVHAIDVLNNTPTNQLRDRVQDVFAVDRWLWFLAVENVFVDDDSYWNKGADYAFYYEPESGQIHPVEHDGNEAFTSAMGLNFRLSPVQGATLSSRPLLFRLLRINEFRQRYLAHMRTVLAERFNPGYLTPFINHFHQLTVAAIAADPKKNFTMASYTNDLVALRRYVTNRYTFLTNHAELRPIQPTILSVQGPSPEPLPGEIPVITATVEATDPAGIDSVWLHWRDKVYGRFSVSQMFDDGAHGDSQPGDGVYGGSTTNFPAGHKIHYYIEARSANSAKAASFAPARAEEHTFSYRVGLAFSTNSAVVINELMSDNEQALRDPQGDFDDWLELRNLSNQQFALSGHYLSDDPTNPRKWRFPDGTTIPANGYLLIWADDDTAESPGLHADFMLSAAGEQLYLIAPDADLNAVLDSVTFPAIPEDWSYGRSPEDPNTFRLLSPTPNLPNIQ